jgi:two-component system response regulator FlrC
MPLALQAKLLRVLQEREVERVGGKKPVSLDIRVLATSNRDMADEVGRGRFREDLYYRLNVFPLEIPALRERRADIVPLARHFLAAQALRSGRTASLAAAAEEKLAAWHWPGNVRELENVIQRALILAPAASIETEHLLFAASAMATAAVVTPSIAAAAVAAPIAPLPPDPACSVPTATRASTSGTASMQELERRHILETLAAVGGSRKKAIEQLGISERTLRYKLKQYREEGWFDGKPDEGD